METARLRLTPLELTDSAEYFAMNSDPEVMRYMPKVLSRQESDELLARLIVDKTFFAVRLKIGGTFIGSCGLFRRPWEDFKVDFAPCWEIGWRFRKEFWNQGYATESAKAVLDWGFQTLGLKEIVSFTVPTNLASRRVMEKIGLDHLPDRDFDHPNLQPGHHLTRHVFYRLQRS